MTVRWDSPGWLVLLAVLPLLPLLVRRRVASIPFSDVRILDVPTRASWRMRLIWLPGFLRLVGLALLVLALARPRVADWSTVRYSDGLRVVWVVDVSGSMATVEGVAAVGPISRLDQAKSFVHQALAERTRLAPGASDQFGLVAFSLSPRLLAPLTSDVEAIVRLTDELAVDRLENRTNIGDAILQAIELLWRDSETNGSIVLISDGAANVPGGTGMGMAARIAESLAVPVTVVSVGSAATARSPEDFEHDLEALAQVAKLTGGRFERAENVSSIADLAEAWGRAQPRPTVPSGFRQWLDLTPWLLLGALGTALVEITLRRTWLHVHPED